MDIRTFIFNAQITITRMAGDIGCTPAHLAGISKKRIRPSKRLAEAIVSYTRGLVTEQDVFAGFEEPRDTLKEYLDKHACVA